jgi:hypothetical protein
MGKASALKQSKPALCPRIELADFKLNQIFNLKIKVLFVSPPVLCDRIIFHQ